MLWLRVARPSHSREAAVYRSPIRPDSAATLLSLAVARQAVIASAFGIRFQGSGYFLRDARKHRDTSGAPVVARDSTQGAGRAELPWMLLGVHATQIDVSNRDLEQDERLDLNCAWYADILLTLLRGGRGRALRRIAAPRRCLPVRQEGDREKASPGSLTQVSAERGGET